MSQPNHIATSKLSRLFMFSKFSLTLSLIIAFFLSSNNLSAQFVTTWKTTVDGETITIPTNSIETYSYTVDWGDGNTTTGETGDATHTYLTAGEHTMSITGLFPRIYFANGGDKDKIIAINQWGTNPWVSMYQAFFGCSNLAGQASDAPNLVGVTDFDHMFNWATSFNQDINNWDVSTIKSMNSMFNSASSFTSDLDNWDTGEVNDMTHMFNGATKFNGNISTWDVRKVETMHYMFNNTTVFDGDIGAWKTDALEGMSGMFYNAKAFNKYIGEWDVSRVKDMVDVFRGTDKYDKPLTNWDTGEVTKMRNMFRDAIAFNKDLSNFNTAKVKKMGEMFRGAIKFNGNIDNWDTGRVEHMGSMFSGAIAFNRDISGWNVSSVERMSYMFEGATSFNNNNAALTWTSGTSTSKVTTMKSMFKEATAFNQDISSWNVSLVDDMKAMFEKATAFNNGNAALTWTNGTGTSKVTKMNSMFKEATAFNQDISSWNVSLVDDMSFMFKDAAAFNNGNAALTWTSGTGTSRVTTLEQMFSGATNFNQDIGSWNVSEVTTMNNMFYQATSFNKDISSWNVSKVTDMTSMFYEATAFNNGNAALTWTSGTGTSKVTGMTYMFRNATSFNQDISSWNVSSVKKMSYMFQDATIFDQNLESWDVTGLTEAPGMFEDVKLSTDNYEKLLISWAAQNVNSGVVFSGGNSTYCSPASVTAHTTLEGKWTITDGENTGCTAACSVPTSERDALIALYNSTDGANWTNNTNWNTTVPVKDWFGVTVDCTTGTVTKIELQNNNLNGASITGNDIPTKIGDLVNLKILDLENNFLTGNIPQEVGDLIQLTYLDFHNNKLSGGIPTNLNKLTNLEEVFLFENALTGSIPNNWTTINSLKRLYVNNNQLSGSIPDFSNSATLIHLSIEDNAYQFGDFESQFSAYQTLAIFKYNPQAKVDAIDTKNLNTGDNTTITTACSGTQNKYQWYKGAIPLSDGGSFSGTQTATLQINNIQTADAGVYHCEVTSTIVTNLTILRNAVTINVSPTTINPNAFITIWKTTTANESITIPTLSTAVYNYTVDWGDGTTTTGETGDAMHSYDIAGEYDVSITGLFPQIHFGSPNTTATNRKKIIAIKHWGTNPWASMISAFKNCTNLEGLATDKPILTNVTDIHAMFYGCSKFNQNINDWDVSTIENMSFMFSNAHIFDQPLNGWDVSHVKFMQYMFGSALKFNQDLNLWDTKEVTNMHEMFQSAWDFNGDITTWNTAKVKDMSNMFRLTKVFNRNIGNWNTNEVTDMSGMFDGAKKFDKDISTKASGAWNTSKVENMSYMFSGAVIFDQDIGNWQTGKVDNMQAMFKNAVKFSKYIGDWNTTKVENMREMLYYAEAFNQDISYKPATDAWNTSNVKYMQDMFRGASIFNGNIGNWKTGAVTNMSTMFVNAKKFTRDLPWDVSSVQKMTGMFAGAEAFDGDISQWMTTNVDDMDAMFQSATAFNGDISFKPSTGAWNTGNVTNMSSMFNIATSFDKNIGNWNTEKVTNMYRMFDRATSFDQNLANWNVEALIDGSLIGADDMFKNVKLSTANYDALLVGWSAQNLNPNVNFSGGLSQYCTAETERAILDDKWGTITDAGKDPSCGVATDLTAFITTWKTTTANENITIPTFSGETYDYTVDWGDSSPITTHTTDVAPIHPYTTAGNYTVSISGKFPRIYFNSKLGDNKDKIIAIKQWGNQKWTSMNSAFSGCSKLAGQTAFDVPDLSKVEDLSYMFSSCIIFNQDIGNWNTSKVKTMSWMFSAAKEFNQDIGNWNTSNVEDMSNMFASARKFNQDISTKASGAWNTSKVKTMSWMFTGASSFDKNIGNWNTSNVENMASMFQNASKFNGNIGSWNTTKVTTMKSMFFNATNFKQDISYKAATATTTEAWNTSAVTSMRSMFMNAVNFNQNIGNWNTGAVTDMTEMFYRAIKFDQNLENWNVEGLINTGTSFGAESMFRKVKLSTTNYDALLKSWSIQNLNPNVNFSGGLSQYCTAEAERAILDDKWGDITDKGKDPNCGVATLDCPSITSSTTDVDLLPTITWNGVTGATAYRVLVIKKSDGTEVVNETLGNVAIYTLTTSLEENTIYQVTIFASDGTTETTGCTAVEVKTKTSTTGLTCPTISSSTIDVDILPTIAWNGITGATAYRVLVIKKSDGTEVVNKTLDNVAIYTLTIPLEENTVYQVTIFASDGTTETTGCTAVEVKTKKTTAILICPTLTSSTTDVDILPTIAWNSITGATNYRVLVVKKSDGTEVVNKTLGNVAIYTLTTTLEENTIYQVTIFASDGITETTGCTAIEVKTIKAVNGVPICTELNSPIDNTKDVATDAALSWLAATNADSYKITIRTNSITIIDTDLGNTTTYPALPGGWTAGQQYFVKIIASNAVGSAIGCNETSFTIAGNLSLTCPTITFPTAGMAEVSLLPTIKWDKVSGATGYTIKIIKTIDNTVFTGGNLGDVSEYLITNTLENNTEYSLVINASNTTETTTCTPIKFTTKKEQIVFDCPKITFPIESQTGVPLTPTIKWDRVSGATRYYIKLVKKADNTVITGQALENVSEFTVPNNYLVYDTEYSVSINAANNETEFSSECTAITFTTKKEQGALNCPTITFPTTGMTEVSLLPTIKWDKVSGATGYTIKIIKTIDNTVFTGGNLGDVSEYLITNTLENNTEYSVVINASNTTETTTCTPIKFTTVKTVTNLTCPTITSSTIDVDLLPTITWSSITGATNYRVLIIKKSDGTEVVNEPLGNVSTYTLTTGLEKNTFYNITIFASDGIIETTGCSAIEVKTTNSMTPNTNDIPNFFTPNNDGTNDFWQVKDENSSIKNIQVFDRYGKLLKQFTTNSQGWDGYYMGNPMPNSDYWYVITLQNEKQLRGHFSLIRR